MSYIVQQSKFYIDHINGKDFTENLTDFNSHLIGSVMNKVKAEFEIDIFWRSKSTNALIFTKSGNNTITRNIGSFLDDEFCIGDTITITGNGGTHNTTITSVSGNTLVFNPPTPFLPIADGIYNDFPSMVITGTTPIDALIFKFGLIENGDPATYNWIDGKEQAYSIGGIQGAGILPLNKIGSICSWETPGGVTVESLGFFGNSQRFKICHEFVITPYYQDGEKTNLETNIAPDIFNGTGSLTYAFSAEFRNVLTDPNCAKEAKEITPLGNVTWYNEPLNNVDEYEITFIDYSGDTSGAVDCLIAGEATQVCFSVSSLSGSFTPTSKVGFYTSLLPSASQYSCKTDSFEDIWCYDCYIDELGTIGVLTNPAIKEWQFNYVTPNLIQVCATINFPKGVTDADCYIIGLDISDNNVSTNTNKTMLIGDVKNFIFDACVPGLLECKGMEFYNHVTDLGSPNFSTDYAGYVEDGVLVCNSFCLNLDQGAIMNNLSMKFVAWNVSDETWFELDSANIPLTGQVIVPQGGYSTQQITVNQTRGYALASGDQFDILTIDTIGLSGTQMEYKVCTGFKMCWQDWLSLPGADTVFFDPTDLNNGLNMDSSNYNLQNGYELRVIMCADISNGSSVTPYVCSSPSLNICGYSDISDSTTEDFRGEIETFDENGLDVRCNILTTENTTIKVTLDYVGMGTAPDLADMYGIIRLEPKNSSSKSLIEESSTVRPILSGGLFLTQSTLTQLSSTQYCLETIVDGSNVVDGQDYKISFKLGCPGFVLCPLPTFDVTTVLISGITGLMEISYDNPNNLPVCITLKRSDGYKFYSSLFNIGENPSTDNGIGKTLNGDWVDFNPYINISTTIVSTSGTIYFDVVQWELDGGLRAETDFCFEVCDMCGCSTDEFNLKTLN